MDIRNEGISTKRFSNGNSHGSGLNQNMEAEKFTKEIFYLHEKKCRRELLQEYELD